MRTAAATAKEPQSAPAPTCGSAQSEARQAGDAAQLLKMLANEKRLLILCFLAVRGEMTVGELVGMVKLSQSALSQHLAKLRADGLGQIPADVADAALQRRRPARVARAAGAERDLLRRI